MNGWPRKTPEPQFSHLAEILKYRVNESGEQTALIDAGVRWTYRQLDCAVREIREWLIWSGVRPGDRLMIVGENCRGFVALLLASTSLDAWPVPVHAHLSGEEVDQIRAHCGARRIVYTVNVSRHAARHAQRHNAVITDPGGIGPLALSPLDERTVMEPIDGEPTKRVAMLMYTTGTTGHPKGVMLTHGNLLFAATGSVKIRSLHPGDYVAAVLPLSHIAGLSVALLGSLISGSALHLFKRFDPPAIFDAMEKGSLTILLGTPAMFTLLVDYAKLKGITGNQHSGLRVISTAGAPLQASVKSTVENFFGLPLQHAYGMTECSPNIAQTRLESPLSDTSVGPAFPGVEIKLIGPDQNEVAEGEVGELWVRGPNVSKGYYRAPEETAAAFDDEGWFKTGDLARSANGNLYIMGRSKELIVHFGFKVYPAEVEAVLNAHPAVARSAVIGRPAVNVEGDEEVVAFVQPRQGASPAERDLVDYVAGRLSAFKVPSKISVIPQLPINPNGKVAREQLAKMAAN